MRLSRWGAVEREDDEEKEGWNEQPATMKTQIEGHSSLLGVVILPSTLPLLCVAIPQLLGGKLCVFWFARGSN
jgi:hypothetical protein